MKAMNVLLQNVRAYDLSPRTLCQLFDAFVASILNYCSEVCGYATPKQIERIHLKYCKKILGVKTATSNVGVYGELARYPLFINRYVQILKYWFKLQETENCVLKTVLKLEVCDSMAGKSNWISNVKKMLIINRFGYIWENPQSVCQSVFRRVFKQRLLDIYIQTWKSDLEANQVLDIYKYYKVNFQYENYLNVSVIKKISFFDYAATFSFTFASN